MMVWKTGKRLFSLLLIVALVLGLATTALAAPVDVIDAKDEIAEMAMAIAGKVVARELNDADQANLVDHFIDELGDKA